MVAPPRAARRPWSQPLADLVVPCLTPALGRFGFDEAGLLLGWPEIVGGRLAARCEPLKLQWPPRRPAGQAGEAATATLVVRVDGPFAIELQHEAPVLIERINAHFGWRCVGRIALRQAPAAPRAPPRARAAPPDADAVKQARAVAGDGFEAGLEEALVRLGARVIAARGRPT